MLDKTKRYLVVGLGLLGGKYALELTKAGFHVDGINRSEGHLQYALDHGYIASGLSFTMKFMEMVGSEIFWNGMETGLSRSPQRVSPMWISGIPETATIEPMPASVTSTFFSPSNSYSLLTFTFFFLVRSWWLTSRGCISVISIEVVLNIPLYIY